MIEDEDRHADEINIAYMLGFERGKKHNEVAWKGIHEGAVLALQARIDELERELEQEKQSREVAAKKAWEFADRIKKLEAVLEKISKERTLWGAMRKADHALGKFDSKALGENNANA